VRDAKLSYLHDDDAERAKIKSGASAVAERLGGYTAGEERSSITLRVPSLRLDEALDDLEGIGKVSSKSTSAREVTSQQIDLSIRIENARKLRARLTALLDRASSVADILAIEKELARTTEELERLEAELRGLSDRVALSTIDIDLEQRVKPGPVGWLFYGVYSGVKWLFVWN
jgi:hypothetical protein